MLLGHWLEMRALGQASSALDALASLLPDDAELVSDGATRTVAAAELAAGDLVLVRPGGRVPADGVVEEGSAELDESMITGESRPVAKAGGDRVVAGTVATDSAIRVRVTAVGEQTALAGIRRLVEQAQASSSRAHALGLAIPLVIAISTALAARNGILVKDRLALERMRTVDAVLFDKTGTLTKGEPTVSGVATVDGDTDELLRLAGGVEAASEHPLARAIVAAARERGDVARAGGF